MIEFHDREKEIEDITRILRATPNLITFVYGPINSGKSSLMDKIAKELRGDYVVFYVDLREKFVKSYEDFVRVLFKTHRTKVKDYKAFLAKVLEDFSFEGLPIPKNLLIELLRSSDVGDIFEYVITVFETVRRKGKTPVLILDELQVIGDLKIDDLLIYRLFNLFVSITKKRHLAHIFAVTSDSLFLEKVFNEAMLHGRCRYLLVDDFDYETTVKFLKKYGFKEGEIQLVWEYFGGKPVYLVEAIKEKDRLKEFCEEQLKLRVTEIKSRLKRLKELGDSIIIDEEEYEIDYNKVVSALSMFKDKEFVSIDAIDEITKHYLVKSNLLFVEPLNGVIKPQSRLDLLAIRKIVEKNK